MPTALLSPPWPRAGSRISPAHGTADHVRFAGLQDCSAVSSQVGVEGLLEAAFFGALAFFAGTFAASCFFTGCEASVAPEAGTAEVVGADATAAGETGRTGACTTCTTCAGLIAASTLSRHSISERVLERA